MPQCPTYFAREREHYERVCRPPVISPAHIYSKSLLTINWGTGARGDNSFFLANLQRPALRPSTLNGLGHWGTGYAASGNCCSSPSIESRQTT